MTGKPKHAFEKPNIYLYLCIHSRLIHGSEETIVTVTVNSTEMTI